MKQAIKANDRIVYKLHKTVFLLNKIADQVLQNSFDLTLPQFLILTVINEYPGVSQLKTAQYLDLTQAAISKQMKTMLQSRIIERGLNPKNRREHVLSITPQGKKLLGRSLDVLDKKMSEIFESLTARDQNELALSLDKITRKIHSRGIAFFCRC